jgi:hypothetical protein
LDIPIYFAQSEKREREYKYNDINKIGKKREQKITPLWAIARKCYFVFFALGYSSMEVGIWGWVLGTFA